MNQLKRAARGANDVIIQVPHFALVKIDDFLKKRESTPPYFLRLRGDGWILYHERWSERIENQL